jgi:hypothetical protein
VCDGNVLCFKGNSIEVYSEKGEVVKSVAGNGTGNVRVYEYKGLKVASYVDQGRVILLDPATLNVVHQVQLNMQINSVYFNAWHFVVATANNSMHVFDSRTGQDKYTLLGGSMNPKTLPKSFVANPTVPGCSLVLIDNDRIVGVFGNLIRVYSFDLDP